MPPDVPTLAEMFWRGANREKGGPVFEDLGFGFRTHRELDGKDGKADVWLGWVTYLARHRGAVPPLPTPVRIDPVEDKGTLIVLTPERFTVANP